MENKETVMRRFETVFEIINSIFEIWHDEELKQQEKRMIISDKARTLKDIIKTELKRVQKLEKVDQLSVYESACYYWALLESNGKFRARVNTRNMTELFESIHDVEAEFKFYYNRLLSIE